MIVQCTLLLLKFVSIVLSDPTGCTYDAGTVLYTCNARSWVLPMNFASFTVQPQRILLKDVAGELPASAPNGPTFTGFSAINTALFDARFSPSFHIMCFANGNLLIFKDTFQDFGWIEEVIIEDCDILSLPADVFSYFWEVNSFIIKGGSIANMVPDSFRGLNVKKMTSALTPKGEFVIKNSQIVSGELSLGALINIANASVVVLEGTHLTSLRKDTFYSLPKLSNLSISYNALTGIPNLLFINSHALTHVSIWGIPWTCSCSELWFLPYVRNNNITLHGDITCNMPYSYAYKRATTYYKQNCMSYDQCGGIIGFVSGGKCITILNIFSYLLFVLMTLATSVAFGLVLNLHLHLKEIKNRRQGFMLRRMNVNRNDKMSQFQASIDSRRVKPFKPRDPSFE